MKYLPVADMRAICQTLCGIPANTFCVRMMICDVEKRWALITHRFNFNQCRGMNFSDFMLDILKQINTKKIMIRAGFCTRTNLGMFQVYS